MIQLKFKNESIEKAIALLLLFIVTLICFLNIYVYGSLPIWDGELYNKLIINFIENKYSFKNIDLTMLPEGQLGFSYVNRIFYFYIVSFVHRILGIELKFIYPLINFIYAYLTAIYLFKICKVNFKLSYVSSMGAGIWFLFFPAVMIINQVNAHPELMMSALIVMGYFYYLNNKIYLSAIAIFLAILTKQTAILVAIFIIVDILMGEKQNKLKIIAPFVILTIMAMTLPYLLVNNSTFRFKWQIVAMILKGLNNNLFHHLLFNFEVISMLFLVGIKSFNRVFQLNVIVIIFLGLILSVIGSTDWFRTWFSILFFIVIPLAAKGIDEITSAEMMHVLRGPLILIFTVMLIKPKSAIDPLYTVNPSMFYYMYTLSFAAITVCYVANSYCKMKETNSKR